MGCMASVPIPRHSYFSWPLSVTHRNDTELVVFLVIYIKALIVVTLGLHERISINYQKTFMECNSRN